MARFNASILGEATGNAGRANFYRWRGKSFVRGRMIARGNANATTAQISVQQRFTILTEFLKKFTPALRLGFVKVPEGKTYLNTAFKANWPAVKDNGGYWQLSYQDVAMSNGVDEFAISATRTESSVDFTWQAPRVADLFYQDGRMCACAYNSATNKSHVFIASLTASTASFDFSGLVTGEDDDITVWYFATTGIISSPSVFLR